MMMEARYLRAKNLRKFQHYGKRNPPWIKLYRSLITGEDKQLDDFLLLDEFEQWQLVRIWLLASQCEGELLSFDERWVRRAIRSVRKVPLEKFVREGWLEVLSAEESDALRASTDASAGDSKTPDFLPPREDREEKEKPSAVNSTGIAVSETIETSLRVVA